MYNKRMSETALTPTEIKRLNQVYQVLDIRFENPTITLADACDEVGIAKSTFYYWMNTSKDFIGSMRERIAEQQRQQLITLESAHNAGLGYLAAAVAQEDTPDLDRVRIMRYLDPVMEQLQRSLHAQPGQEEEAHEFLKEGPHIETKKSRLASVEVRTGDDGVTLDIYKEQDVIDVTPSDQ